MYRVIENGVLKKIETWKIILPRYYNDGKKFPDSFFDSLLEDITLNFGGCTLTNCIGYWKGNEKIYNEPNFEALVDVAPFEPVNAEAYFLDLKKELEDKLKQEKIYLKRTNAEEEVMTFDEFFREIGLLTLGGDTKEEKRELALKCVEQPENIIKRLGYKTLHLERDQLNKKIIWEREICGIKLKDEFEDTFPEGFKIFAADEIDKIGDTIIREREFGIIGQHEFQNYILEKFNYKPIVETELGDEAIDSGFKFLNPSLEIINVKRFVEDIVGTIFIHYVILREEGFPEDDILITAREDGSMQYASGELGNFIMLTPADIPFPAVVEEIVRCIEIAKDKYEKNEIDPVSLLQTKARNKYIISKAQIRYGIKKARDI